MAFPEGMEIPDKLLDAAVGGQLISSLLCNGRILLQHVDGAGQGKWFKKGFDDYAREKYDYGTGILYLYFHIHTLDLFYRRRSWISLSRKSWLVPFR